MECDDCVRFLPDIKTCYKSEKHVLSMHVEYWVLGQSGKKGDERKKEHVKQFTETFFKNVCSLRNSKGGVLAIHVQNKNDNSGPCLDDFDQKVSKDLSYMIEDDSPYVFNYQRRWFVDESGRYSGDKYIVVIVKGSSSVSTKSFNTLVPYDGSKERARARELAMYMSEDRRYGLCIKEGCLYVKGGYKEGEHVDIIESRGVQFKSMSEEDLKKDILDHGDIGRAEGIVFRLIEKLHLLQYITTFSKLVTGGSFFLGIEEEKGVIINKTVNTPVEQERGRERSRARQRLEFHDEVPSNICERNSERTKSRRSERYKEHGGQRSTRDERGNKRPTRASREEGRYPRSVHSDRYSERDRSRSRSREDQKSPRTANLASGSNPRHASTSSSKYPIPKSTASKVSGTEPRLASSSSSSSSRSSIPSSTPSETRGRVAPDSTHRGHRTSRVADPGREGHEGMPYDQHRGHRTGRGADPGREGHEGMPYDQNRGHRTSRGADPGREGHEGMPYDQNRGRERSGSGSDSRKEGNRKQSRSFPPLTIENKYSSPLSPPTPVSASPRSPMKLMKTGHNIVRGFQLEASDTGELVNLLKKEISQNMMWLRSDGDCLTVCDIDKAIAVELHSVGQSKYVLEVNVKELFPGLVFFTKEGPEAYRLEQGMPVRIGETEWMELLKSATKCAACSNFG
ncbi:uncharacterized protein LOC124150050 isoform X1 [Haliotis rufescens]|uniref:uncharacterized protein LOC124150050 isoform X1 n=2 Tax=Haliotis rufescens TaxID=6454 RepID=UPI00201FADB7|nr:uncharacterized protein LOC124150050 isoform X1 [Haliotis rufescens]